MAEPVHEFVFSHKEVVEALIKKQGIHEGIWMLNVRFGIGAMNVLRPEEIKSDSEGGLEVAPAAIVPILSIGLAKQKTLNPLALDAAEINPAPTSTAHKKK